jgi:hypothetical protein
MSMMRRILVALALVLTVSAGFVVGRASAAQPQMQTALTHLRQARTALDRATADKGGHRGRALALVNDAIKQVEEGIEYDRRH